MIKLGPVTKEWFWQRVLRRNKGCWLWIGGKTAAGYGLIRRRPHVFYSHRLVWQFSHGDIPEGFHVLHHCDNAACCNPDHLFLGTHRDNMMDKVGKHRHLRSDGRAFAARLLWTEVEEIRNRIKEGSRGCEIARDFGISQALVCDIKKGRRWGRGNG